MAIAELGILMKAKDEASGVISGAGDKLGGLMKIAGIGAAAGGAALIGFGVGAVKMAGDFDGAMREVNTLIGLNEKSFQGFTAEVNNMAKSMGVDAVGSSKALYQAISAGVPKENAIDFLKVATKAAIGGVTDTETAVDGLTTVLNAFKLPAGDVEKVADQMFTTVKLGKTTFGELSKSLFNVAAPAAAAGVEFKEVAAGLATMTKSGVPTSVATTQLRQAIVELQKPGKELSAILEKTGFASGKALLAEKGLQGAMVELRKAADGAGLSFNEVFGSVEAANAGLLLTGPNAQMAAEDLKALNESAGSSGAAFEEMNKSFGRQMEKLQQTFNGLMITVGLKLLPAITPLIGWLSDKLPVAMETAEKVLQPFLGVIGGLVGMLTGAKGAGTEFSDSLGKIGEMAGQALGWLGNMVKEWLPKIGAMLLDLGQKFIAWIGPMIPPMLAELGKLATRLFDWAKGEAPKLLKQLAAWGQQLIDWIKPMIPPLLAEAGKLAQKLFAWLGDQVPKLMDQLAEWRKQAIAWLSDAIPPLLTEAGKLVENLLNFIIDQGPPLMTKFLTEWLPAALGWVVQAALDIIPKLLELVLAIGTWIVTIGVPKLAEFAFKMGQAILGGILDGLGKLAGMLGEAIGDALRSLKIDIGPFHLDASGFRIDMPQISLPAGQPAGPPGSIYGYASGGVVPGPKGAPQLAVVHGGERITPAGAGGITVNLTVQGSILSEREITQVVREGLLRIGRRVVTGGVLA